MSMFCSLKHKEAEGVTGRLIGLTFTVKVHNLVGPTKLVLGNIFHGNVENCIPPTALPPSYQFLFWARFRGPAWHFEPLLTQNTLRRNRCIEKRTPPPPSSPSPYSWGSSPARIQEMCIPAYHFDIPYQVVDFHSIINGFCDWFVNFMIIRLLCSLMFCWWIVWCIVTLTV